MHEWHLSYLMNLMLRDRSAWTGRENGVRLSEVNGRSSYIEEVMVLGNI